MAVIGEVRDNSAAAPSDGQMLSVVAQHAATEDSLDDASRHNAAEDDREADEKADGWPQLWALVAICASIFSAMSIWFCASAILSAMTAAWGISKAQGSFLTSMVNVGFCLGCLGSAALGISDRVPGPKLILLGSLGAAASNAGLLLGGGFYGALACRLLVGMSLSMVYPPGVKLLSTWFSTKERGRAIGIMFGAFCLGSAFPNLLSGLISPDRWRGVVVMTSSAAAVSGLCTWLYVGIGPFAFPATGGRLQAADCAAAVSSRRVRLAILAYCGHMWELFCVWAWAASFLQSSWHLSPTAAPLVAFCVIAMGGPGSWCGGVLGDRFGRVQVAAASLATSGLCVGLLGSLADEGPLFLRVSIFLLWGLTGLSDSPQFSAIVIQSTDQRYVGTAVTVQLLCGYLVTVLALWVVPWFAAEVSWRWSFFSLVAGPIVGLLALLGLSIDRDEAGGKGSAAMAGAEESQRASLDDGVVLGRSRQAV